MVPEPLVEMVVGGLTYGDPDQHLHEVLKSVQEDPDKHRSLIERIAYAWYRKNDCDRETSTTKAKEVSGHLLTMIITKLETLTGHNNHPEDVASFHKVEA